MLQDPERMFGDNTNACDCSVKPFGSGIQCFAWRSLSCYSIDRFLFSQVLMHTGVIIAPIRTDSFFFSMQQYLKLCMSESLAVMPITV